jgi:hypothetical protein
MVSRQVSVTARPPPPSAGHSQKSQPHQPRQTRAQTRTASVLKRSRDDVESPSESSPAKDMGAAVSDDGDIPGASDGDEYQEEDDDETEEEEQEEKETEKEETLQQPTSRPKVKGKRRDDSGRTVIIILCSQ